MAIAKLVIVISSLSSVSEAAANLVQVVLPSCPCLGLHTPVPAQIAAQYPGLGYAPRDGPDTLISGLKKAANHYNEADPWRNLENEPVPFHLPHKHRGENVGTSEQINPLAGSVYSVNPLNPLLEYNEVSVVCENFAWGMVNTELIASCKPRLRIGWISSVALMQMPNAEAQLCRRHL